MGFIEFILYFSFQRNPPSELLSLIRKLIAQIEAKNSKFVNKMKCLVENIWPGNEFF